MHWIRVIISSSGAAASSPFRKASKKDAHSKEQQCACFRLGEGSRKPKAGWKSKIPQGWTGASQPLSGPQSIQTHTHTHTASR